MTETPETNQPSSGKNLCFSFGDPEPILSSTPADYLGIFTDIHGLYYKPPVSLEGLAKMMGANAYHGPILHFKKNMLMKWFQPSRLLSRIEMKHAALDYVTTGNAYLQILRNGFGQVVRLKHQPALYMRRSKQQRQYIKLKQRSEAILPGEFIEFQPDEIIHIKEPDLRQKIYGVPEYLGGIQAVLLSEESTLFRRKYYLNGAHMGYILVTNDADLDDETAKQIEKQVTQSKGPGNFRSLYLNIGRSNAKEPVQIIPVGDIGTKDEFERIKNITKDEMLAMHRMQPGLSGIIPQNTGGFGDIEKIRHTYYDFEVTTLQASFLEINDLLGRTAVRFIEPDWKTNGA